MSIDPGEIERAISDYYSIGDGPDMDPIRKFVVLVLWQAQRDDATQLIIDTPGAEGGVPIRYEVHGTWYEMMPFPGEIRAQVVQTTISMARAANEVVFPMHGEIDDQVSGKVHLKWHVSLAAAEAPIHFQRA